MTVYTFTGEPGEGGGGGGIVKRGEFIFTVNYDRSLKVDVFVKSCNASRFLVLKYQNLWL